MASLRKILVSAVLAASLVMGPAPSAALTVIIPEPPPENWQRVVNLLSDLKIDGNELMDEAFDAFWIAAGNAIAQTQICREAYANFYSRGNNASFDFSITVVAQGDPPVTYAQPIHVVPQPDGSLVVGVVRGEGRYAKIFRCGGRFGAQSEEQGPVAEALLAAQTPPPPPIEGTQETRGGVDITTFETPKGRVVVYLPDDMAAGDTISGTVTADPNGENDAERSANAAELRGLGVELPGASASAGDGLLLFTVPLGGVVTLVLTDGPRRLGAANIPTAPPLTPPGQFTIPAVTEAARPATITGPFDGNASNTQVTVNGVPCPVLAESPRQVVLMTPVEVGPMNVQVREGEQSAQGVANNLGINLSAERLTLARGERTTVNLQAVGLNGLQAPANVRVWASSTVRLEGGNVQVVAIDPGSVSPSGGFQRQFDLRVVAAGPFDVVAELSEPICTEPIESAAAQAMRHALRNVKSAQRRTETGGGAPPRI